MVALGHWLELAPQALVAHFWCALGLENQQHRKQALPQVSNDLGEGLCWYWLLVHVPSLGYTMTGI
jgi:hypothetical protein